MPAAGPRLLALLLVTAAVGAGCTGDPGESGQEPALPGCSWAARFTDPDAYHTLAAIPPNTTRPDVDHRPWPHEGGLPFENRTLENHYGPLRLKRVLHAADAPALANPSVSLARWAETPTQYSTLVDPPEAGLRVESAEKRDRPDGNDAFVAFVEANNSQSRDPLIRFLGEVTDADEENRSAWVHQALENRTPVDGQPYDRVELPFRNVDTDVVHPDVPEANLTLSTLYQDLAAEANASASREPGRLVVETGDWWWVFELEHVVADLQPDDEELSSELVVDRGGEAGTRIYGRDPATPAELQKELAETYDVLGLGTPPNPTFFTLDRGSPCPDPEPPLPEPP